MSQSNAGHFLLIVALALLPQVATGADTPPSTIDEINRVIRESEYHMTWQDQTVLPDLDAAWHATNRAQNLRFYFTEDGLRVMDRTAEVGRKLLRLNLVRSFTETKRSVAFEPAGNELTVHRDGLTEVFVNTGGGLEHHLIVEHPGPQGGPLVIEMDLSGAGITPRTDALDLVSTSGRRLTYSVVEALDATGVPVEIELGLDGGRPGITFTGAEPVWPVTIKNLLSGTANTVLEGNLTDLWFGWNVASGDLNGDGFTDVAVIVLGWDGGQNDDGAVMVFHGGPDGIASNPTGQISSMAATIIESNVAGCPWPTAIAVVGDVNGDGYDDLAVSDILWDPVNPTTSSQLWGAVWIFHGSASGVTATNPSQADRRIESSTAWADFGWSLDGAGDVNGDGYADLIAGADEWSDDPSQPREGAAFVFQGSANGITATTTAEADATIEGNEPIALAGYSVSGIGDVNGDGYGDVAVGIPSMNHPEPDEGGIVVFHGSATGIAANPTQPPADVADALIEGNGNGHLGGSVAGAGDVNGDGFADMIVGNPGWEDSAPHSDEGVVVIFHGGPAGIASNGSAPFVDVANTEIQGNPNPHASWGLGSSVGGIGDLNGDGFADVALGAYRFSNPELQEGGFFVFHGGPEGVPNSRVNPVHEVADAVIEGNMAVLFLGGSPPAGGDVNGDGYSDLILGAGRWNDDPVQTMEGAVFIYHGGAEALAHEADEYHDFSVAGALFGSPARGAGDLNGDGFADFVVGAPLHDVVSNREGSAHVFYGSTDPSISSPDWSFEGQYQGGWTGVGVASAGDLNGDGFGDLVVGTPYSSNPETDEGRVDVFYGSASGIPSTPDWSYEGNLENAGFGRAVSTAGDIDGDGYGDLIVGAPDYSNGETFEGRAYVFFGSSMGLPSNPGWTYESDVASAELGFSVAAAGDVNGDGFGDVIVGAYGYTSGESYEGAAYGFYGSENGLPVVPNWFIQTNRVDAYYGISVAGVGDINGDGFSDVIVGAPYDTNGESQEGRAYVYHGSISGLSTIANQVLEENIADAGFGVDVAAAGDVNGDGISDVVVGSPFVGVPGSYDGRAYLYLGTAAGVASEPVWLIEAPGANGLLGHSVAGVGDLNGDGFSDVVVGVPGSDSGSADGGSVELYLGNAGAGRPVLARQYRGGEDPTPVQPWGLSHSGDAFEVSMTATSPRGRELVKLHVEACPPGEVWGGVDCRHVVSADWTAIPLGEDGVVLAESLTGLTEGELYHWRAHALYVPLHADKPGITTPPVPRHGPWRTLFAQAPAADIRVGVPQVITIDLAAVSSSVAEGAAQAEVGVVVTTSDGLPTEVDCEADFATSNGTAFAGEDYVSTSGNAFFGGGTPNGTVQILPVGLINDDLDEQDEDFVVEIFNPTAAILGPQIIHAVTILDDDPPPELSAADVQIDEGAGFARVTLELSTQTSFEVTVNYATTDGTAVAPLDFGHVAGVALIPPMDTVFNIDIPIENDWLEEDDESFTLDLTSPANAALVTPVVTIIIHDDDAGILFGDGFESGDTGRWTHAVPSR